MARSPRARASRQWHPAARGAAGPPWRVETANCLERLPELDAESVDAILTDPPYGIEFQGEEWDGKEIDEVAEEHAGYLLPRPEAFQVWSWLWAEMCLRLLRPGGYMLCFGFPRVEHRLTCGIEEAGFEVRDKLLWLFATGMPKSRHLPDGLGSAIKPAYEPIIMARKPLEGTLKENLARHGTGALNVDACRLGEAGGRYPANVVLGHLPECGEVCAEGCPVAHLDACADLTRCAGSAALPASRFFYCPKVSRAEREAGCEGLPLGRLDLFPGASAKPASDARNPHPTVKPIALMRWLIRLATPPGGTVLDPFSGSGSTGIAAVLEGRDFIGIERDAAYAEIARARIAHWQANPPQEEALEPGQRSACKPRSQGKARATGHRPGEASPGIALVEAAKPGFGQVVALDEASIDRIAEAVVERLGQARAEPQALLSPTDVANRFGVERSWVYEHADQLGAIRIGDGPRPRLRFDPARVERHLAGDRAPEPKTAPEPDPGRLAAIPADSAPLLPIRGTQS